MAPLHSTRAACSPTSTVRRHALSVAGRLTPPCASTPSCAGPSGRPASLPVHIAIPIPMLAGAVAAMLTASPALAAEAPELFANKCAGCHMNGGNVLAVGATLFPEDLRRNGVDSSEALYRIVYSGKGKMPGFGKDCAPRGACTFGPRLSDEEVAAVADYVSERAAAGWKQQEGYTALTAEHGSVSA